MRLICILTLSLAVAACANPLPAHDRWLALCDVRASTIRSLTTLQQGRELSDDTTERVTTLVLATAGQCAGDGPPSTTAALQRLETNILQLVTIKGAADAKSAN